MKFLIFALATLAVSGKSIFGMHIGGSYVSGEGKNDNSKISAQQSNNVSNHRTIVDEIMVKVRIVERQVAQVERNFEETTKRHNQSELKLILTELELTKRNISINQANLISFIHTDQIHNFYDRVMAGWINVDLQSLDSLVTSMALEILGVNANFIDFPKTEMVDSLKSVLEVSVLKLSERFGQLLQKIDQGIKEVHQMMGTEKPVPSSLIRTISNEMSSLISLTKASKDTLTAEYYPVRERLGAEGKLLDRMQKFEVERFINALYYIQNFVLVYQTMFLKFGVQNIL